MQVGPRRPFILVLVAVILMVSIGAFVVLYLATSAKPAQGPASQVSFPARWIQTFPADGLIDEQYEIYLEDDGDARVLDLVVGSVRGSTVPNPCVEPNSTTFSGAATWWVDDQGVLHIATGSGDAIFGPTSARFGDVSWTGIQEPICDSRSITYSLAPAQG